MLLFLPFVAVDDEWDDSDLDSVASAAAPDDLQSVCAAFLEELHELLGTISDGALLQVRSSHLSLTHSCDRL